MRHVVLSSAFNLGPLIVKELCDGHIATSQDECIPTPMSEWITKN